MARRGPQSLVKYTTLINPTPPILMHLCSSLHLPNIKLFRSLKHANVLENKVFPLIASFRNIYINLSNCYQCIHDSLIQRLIFVKRGTLVLTGNGIRVYDGNPSLIITNLFASAFSRNVTLGINEHHECVVSMVNF